MNKILAAIAILILISGPAHAQVIHGVVGIIGSVAIALDAVSKSPTGTTDFNGNSTPLTWSHTSTGSDRLLIVNCSTHLGTETLAITYNGVSFTNYLWQGINYGGTQSQSAWYLIAPATGANTISVTFSGIQNGAYTNCAAASFTGVHQTTPIGTVVTANGSGTTPTVTVSSATGDLVVDGVCPGGAPTKDSSQTATFSGNGNLGPRIFGSSKPGASSITMSWTQASNYWTIGAVPLKQAHP